MAIEDQIQTLIDQVGDLVDATTVKKAYFDTNIAVAKAAASDAAASIATTLANATTAASYRDQAQAIVNDAQGLRDDLASVVSQDLSAIAADLGLTGVTAACWFGTALCKDPFPLLSIQHRLSWYNEGENGYRGPQKEMPAIGPAFAIGDRVHLYSLDTGSLELWMTFRGSYYWAGGTMLTVMGSSQVPISGLSFAEGRLYVSSADILNGNAAGLAEIDFVRDKGAIWNGTGKRWTNHKNIAARNDGAGCTAPPFVTPGLTQTNTNGVKAAVRPDAPRDPITGMLIPTVAAFVGLYGVANGGLNIIRPDNTIRYTKATTAGGGYMGAMGDFDGDRVIVANVNSSKRYLRLHVFDNGEPAANENAAALYANAENMAYEDTSFNVRGGLNGAPAIRDLASSASRIALALEDRLAMIYLSPDHAEKAVAHIKTTYNSGYMLPDTAWCIGGGVDTNSIVGGDISGDFTLENGGSYDAATGHYSIERVSEVTQSIVLTVPAGATVRLVAEKISGATVLVRDGSSVLSDVSDAQMRFHTDGEVKTVIATVSSGSLKLNNGNYPLASVIKIHSAEIVAPDRSINVQPATVVGTLSKTKLSGHDAAAWSWMGRFSVAEVTLPLDDSPVGADDFTLDGWFICDTVSSANQYLLTAGKHVDVGGWIDGRLAIYVNTAGAVNIAGNIELAISDGPTAQTITTTGAIALNVPFHVAAVRKGSLLSLYLNGSLVGSLTLADGYDMQCEGGVWAIGDLTRARDGSGTLKRPLYGWCAVARLAKTAASADLIATRYQAEKPLAFGARASLYGTSSDVKQVAVDPVTNRTHLSTATNRQVLDGLAVVEWSETAAASALEAFNGMVIGA